MRFKKTTNLGWGARIGFGGGEEKYGRKSSIYHVPIMIYNTSGKERSMLEYGFGTTLTRSNFLQQADPLTVLNEAVYELHVIMVGNLGLRLQAQKTGAIARIGLHYFILVEE